VRILLVIIGLLAALIVGLSYAAPVLISVENYRSEIEARASEVVGQPVQLNGDMSFRVLPTPRLNADTVIVTPPAGRLSMQPLLEIETLQLRLSLNSLLLGTVEVDSVVLVRPQLTLQTDLANHDNFEAVSLVSGAPDNLRIINGTVHFLDQHNSRSLRVANVEGTLNRNPRNGVLSGGFTGASRDHRGQIDVRLGGGARASLNLALQADGLGKASFSGRMSSNEGWKATGRLALELTDAQKLIAETAVGLAPDAVLGLSVTGNAEISATGLILEQISGRVGEAEMGGHLSLSIAEAIKVDTAISFEQLQADTFLPWLQQSVMRLNQGELATDISDPTEINARLNVGLIDHRDRTIRQLSIRAAYARGDVSISRASALLPGGSNAAFVGDLRLVGGAFRLQGAVELASDNFAALLDWAGVQGIAAGHERLRNMNISSTVLVNGQVAQFTDIDLRIDQSRVTGGAAVALIRRPSFSLNLSVDRLNANAYHSALGLDGHGWREVFGRPEAPDLRWLGTFDTNTKLTVNRLIVGTSALRDLQLDISLLQGTLNVTQFQIGDLDGAALEVSGRIDTPEDPQLVLRSRITAASPAPLLAGSARFLMPFSRLNDFSADIGIEGSLKRSALQLDFRAQHVDGSISGLVSDGLADPVVDLDVAVNGEQADTVAQTLIAGWRAPVTLSGPVNLQAVVKGTRHSISVGGRLDLMGARLEAEGRLTAPDDMTSEPTMDLQLRLRHGNANQLAAELWPDLGAGGAALLPLDASGRIKGDRRSLALSAFTVTAGAQGFKGRGILDTGATPPRAELAVSELRLDAPDLMASPDSGPRAAAMARDRALRWSRLPLDLDWLNSLHLGLDVQAEKLVLPDLPTFAGTARLDIIDKVMTVSDIDGNMADGRLTGSAALDGNASPQVRLDLSADAMQSTPLLGFLLWTGSVPGGALTFNISGKGQGVTPFDIARSFQGILALSPSVIGDTTFQGELHIGDGLLRARTPLDIRRAAQNGRLIGAVDLSRWHAEMELVPDADATWPRSRLYGPLYAPVFSPL